MKEKYLQHEDRLKLITKEKSIFEIDRSVALDIIDEYFAAMPSLAVHHVWEENGQKYSAWEFQTESGDGQRKTRIHTGDGGAMMMYEAFENEKKKYLK